MLSALLSLSYQTLGSPSHGILYFAYMNSRMSETLHDLYYLYSSSQSEAMLKLSRSVRGHFVALIKVAMRLISCNPGHICSNKITVL